MSGNALRLHIKKNALELSDFKKSFDAFSDMIKALSEDAVPTATWLVSVDRGSMLLNAQLTTEDDDIDLEPMFKVIEGGVAAMSSGDGVSSCPKEAREAYKKLVAAVGSHGGKESMAEILSIDGHNRTKKVMPVDIVHEGNDEKSGYIAVGAITGKVYSLTSKHGHKLRVVDESTGRNVKGNFDIELLDEVRKSFDKRAIVSGIIHYHPNGIISSMDVRGVRIQPDHTPKLSELFGILEA